MNPAIKIVAVITTFNPQIERFKHVLDAITNQCIKIIIVDNNSQNFENIKHLCSSYNNVEIIRNDKNYGLGKALNEGIEFVKNDLDRIDYLLTLDQDSIVKCNLREILNKFWNIYNKTKVGIINLNPSSKNGDEYYVNNFPIISGSLVNPSVFRDGLRYREEFFMDQIDFDFDFQVRRLGYSLFSTATNCISHQLGVKKDNDKFSTESPIRLYLIAKNSFILLKERKIDVYFFVTQLTIWLRNDLLNHKNKIFYIFYKYLIIYSLGIMDGIVSYILPPDINRSIIIINSFKFN